MNNKHIILLSLAVLSDSPIAYAAEYQSRNLRAGEVHESCHKLAAGADLKYSFQSSSDTRFNIHFHQGKVISYPVAKLMTSSKNGTLKADTAQTYCLMWTNPQNQTLTLRYEVDIAGK